MAQSREHQEVTFVITQVPSHGQDRQEVIFVIGPTVTIAPSVSKKKPQVAVIS